ncbi:hypothetical protein [Thiohalorhabdus sp.]|uniref:hypothetical protein n=1 Tax=Thiohalorhabdus sp. TaxID=3094134 RepID=UPI002FC37244
MPEDKWLEVTYEDFGISPERELGRVRDFLGLEAGAAERKEAVAGVQATSVGKGREALDGDAVGRLERLVGDALGRFGYG